MLILDLTWWQILIFTIAFGIIIYLIIKAPIIKETTETVIQLKQLLTKSLWKNLKNKLNKRFLLIKFLYFA